MDRFRSLLERRSLVAGLAAGSAVLLLTTILLGANSILAARDMARQAAELYQMDLLGISRIREANIDLISTGRTLRQMVLAPTFVDRDQARDRLDRTMLALEEEITAARGTLSRDSEKLLLNEFELEFEHYKRNVGEAIALIDGSNDYQQKATVYISGEQFNQVGDAADQLLHRMVAIKEEGARETAAAMARHGQHTQWLALGLLLGGLVFGTTVAVSIGRSMKKAADRPGHSIDNGTNGIVGDAIPLTGCGSELGVEEQTTAMRAHQVELIPTEARGVVANTPGAMLMAAEQSAIDPPESIAMISGEEGAWKHLDESHIAPIREASILVVEDNESHREVTVALLASAGCRVTMASNGQEVLELLEKSPYDIVLMNMQMPMTDGINATLEIRKNPAFDRLPIIAMTANGIHQDRARCLAAGMDGYIAKPIDPDELFRALMCWMTPETLSLQPRHHRSCESPRI